MAPELRPDDVILRYTAEQYAALVRQAKGADLLIRDVRAFFDGTDAPLGQAAREWLAGNALHASPSPSASEDTRAESGAEVPASVKGAVRAWDRSGCRETVCYCHDEASTPRFCGHCGCRPEQAQVSP